jgi:hypothetical protein
MCGSGELCATAEHAPAVLLRIGNRLNPGRAGRCQTHVWPRGSVQKSKWSAQTGPPSPSLAWVRKWHTSAVEPVRRHSLLTRTTGLLIMPLRHIPGRYSL